MSKDFKIHQEPTVGPSTEITSGSHRAAQVIMNNGDLDDLRVCKEQVANATLRRDEWEKLDDALMQASRQTLVGIQDLRDQNLTITDLDIGVTVSTIERTDQGLGAERSMSGSAPPTQNQLNIDELSFPIPFYQTGYGFSLRKLRASRNRGEPLNVFTGQEAMEETMDLLEADLFNGAGITYRGADAQGYTNEGNRNTVSGSDWGTNTNIIPDVNSAEETLLTDGFGENVPKALYVANTQYNQMKDPFTDQPGVSPLDVLEDRSDIAMIKPSGKLTDEAVLVAMSNNVVDLMIAEDFTNVEWEAPSGTWTHFKSMFVGIPRVKSDQASQSGVAHITGI